MLTRVHFLGFETYTFVDEEGRRSLAEVPGCGLADGGGLR
jgi:hypothetical protein